eukprot:TRINITY_DN23297_c0_g1_i1.p1 TRINITY_DN23297_c0_g1~~TRINITY_DN23297_c0_g1_i1.p1  ORF type:complete len:121 (-),score=38.85 TRINITY_DN23297_c0_g1_i1:18-380(-)
MCIRDRLGFRRFGYNVMMKSRKAKLSIACATRQLEHCHALRRLSKHIPTLYRHRLKKRMMAQWMEFMRLKMSYETPNLSEDIRTVSYTHLRAHETVLDLVCRLLLEKKKKNVRIHDNYMT